MIQLLKGDCLELMQDIESNSIDFILTDPPYGTTACKWDSVIPFEPMWEQIKRVRKDRTAVALFGSEPFSSALRMSNIKEFKYDWIWEKNIPTGQFNIKYAPMKIYENISIFGKHKFYPIKEKRSNGSHNYKEGKKYHQKSEHYTDTIRKTEEKKEMRYPTNILKYKKPHPSKAIHPTQKPIALMEYLILTYTLEGETVLDFTIGSGSTGVACKNLNRNFIGIEKDENYFNIAGKRINEM